MGNVLKDGLGNTFTYDAENRLTSVDSNSFIYTYDAFSRRVEQNDNGTKYDYVYSQSGIADLWSSSGLQWAQLGGNNALGIYWLDSGSYTTNFYHENWLGTMRAMSTATGGSFSTCSDQIFGDNTSCTIWGPGDIHFTGQEYDNAGLTHFPMRNYSPTQGRWMHTDPAGLAAVDITNPQTWNRYAYVMDDPVDYTDPLGLYLCDDPSFADAHPLGCAGAASALGGGLGSTAGCGSDFLPCGPPPSVGPSLPCDLGFCGPSIGYGLGEDPAMSDALPSPLFTFYANGYGGCIFVLLNPCGFGAANNGPSNVSCNSTTGICVPATMMKPRPAGCGAAIAQGAISLGLDVVGAIPAFGNVVSATAAGARAVNGIVAYGGAAYGIATGLGDESPFGAVSAGTGLGLTLADAALEGGKAIPIAGNVLSVLTGGYDAYQLAKTIGKCW